MSTRHYTPGTNKTVPVIVLDGGETSGEDRLPYLDTGIVDILAEATGGVGVVLEHRYYGTLLACNWWKSGGEVMRVLCLFIWAFYCRRVGGSR